MTLAQLDEARKRSADFHARDFQKMKATEISIPVEPGRTCSPIP
jgi:hypothetical protein